MIPLCVSDKEPIWDIVPVLKLTIFENPLDVNHHIYGQVQFFYTSGKGMFVRLLSFESLGEEGDASRYFELCLKTDTGTMHLAIASTGVLKRQGEHQQSEEQISIFRFAGGDLQGEYWGLTVFIEEDFLLSVLSFDVSNPTAPLYGNAANCALQKGRLSADEFAPFEVYYY